MCSIRDQGLLNDIFGVNLDIVWNVIQEELADLIDVSDILFAPQIIHDTPKENQQRDSGDDEFMPDQASGEK